MTCFVIKLLYTFNNTLNQIDTGSGTIWWPNLLSFIYKYVFRGADLTCPLRNRWRGERVSSEFSPNLEKSMKKSRDREVSGLGTPPQERSLSPSAII